MGLAELTVVADAELAAAVATARTVVDGKICLEFPPSDEQNFFFRFRIE